MFLCLEFKRYVPLEIGTVYKWKNSKLIFTFKKEIV